MVKRVFQVLVTVWTLSLLLASTSWAQLVAAVLPASRSVQVGVPATAFATIINAGSVTATGCGIAPLTGLQDPLIFQTTDPATNQVTGTANTRVDILPGRAQSFVFAFTPSVALAPTDVQLSFACINTTPATITFGLNTLLLSASTTPIPDIVALAATLNNDGIVTIPTTTGTGVFAVATVNVGASGTITATADTGITSLPVTLSLCQTDPAAGNCITPIGPSVTTTINANATPTFGVFVTGSNTVPFDPAANRISVRFSDAGGVTRGATSVAVRTQGAPSGGTATSVTGTAASGGPIANAAITAKDATGASRTTTTDANGKYSLDVTGLTAPLLLKVDGGTGKVFFSVGGQVSPGTTVVNVHPLTDLIIRTWYEVQGQTVEGAFTNPAPAPPPTATEVLTIVKVVVKIVAQFLTANGVDVNTFDPIATPFTANHSGFDKVLDSLTINTTTKTITINDPATSVTQSTTLTTNTGTGAVTSTTATGTGTTVPVCGAANVSCNVTSTVVTTTPAQVAALDGVLTTLKNVGGVVNSKGAALAANDLLGFFDANYLDDGLNQNAGAQDLARDLSGATLNSFTVRQISSFDSAKGLIGIAGEASVSVGGVTTTQVVDNLIFKQEANGSWLFFGNQRFARVSARAEFEHRFDLFGTTFNDFLFLQARAPVGIISSASVVGSDNRQFNLFKNPTIFFDTGSQTEHFDPCPSTGSTSPGGTPCSGPGPLIPRPSTALPGTVETFTVTRASDGLIETASETLNALTSEAISITGLTGHTLADAKLGQPLTVSWTLPKTFTIRTIGVLPGVSAANSQGQTFGCGVDTPDLPPTATSFTFTFPTTCNGLAVGANLGPTGPTPAQVRVLIEGVNGERTAAWWPFK